MTFNNIKRNKINCTILFITKLLTATKIKINEITISETPIKNISFCLFIKKII